MRMEALPAHFKHRERCGQLIAKYRKAFLHSKSFARVIGGLKILKRHICMHIMGECKWCWNCLLGILWSDENTHFVNWKTWNAFPDYLLTLCLKMKQNLILLILFSFLFHIARTTKRKSTFICLLPPPPPHPQVWGQCNPLPSAFLSVLQEEVLWSCMGPSIHLMANTRNLALTQ